VFFGMFCHGLVKCGFAIPEAGTRSSQVGNILQLVLEQWSSMWNDLMKTSPAEELLASAENFKEVDECS